MKENPLVSVIIPVYNATMYVCEAIESVLKQTYKNIEIIIIDDGSTDGLNRTLEPYLKCGIIHYLHQENSGLSTARNTGIKVARGEYIALLDADDIFLPEKIQTQVEYLKAHPECDISYCDIWHFYEVSDGQNMNLRYKYYSESEVFPNLLKKNFINPLTIVMRRSVFERFGFFNEGFLRSEDWEYWIRLSWFGAHFCFLPEKLARYRIRHDSLSYNWKNEVERKQKELDIFLWLQSQMSRRARWKYHIWKIIFVHWLKLFYALAGDKVKILRILHSWLQRKRLMSV